MSLRDCCTDLGTHWILPGTEVMGRKADIDFFFSVSNTMMYVSFVLFYFIVFLHCYWLPIYCQIKANSSADTLPDLAPVCSPFSHHILIHILPNPLELSFLPLFFPVTSDLLSCKVLPQWTPGSCPNQH